MPSKGFYVMPRVLDIFHICFSLLLRVFGSRVSGFIQLFFLSASQTQSSSMDDSPRPSVGDTPTDLNKLFLGEALYDIQLKARIQ